MNVLKTATAITQVRESEHNLMTSQNSPRPDRNKTRKILGRKKFAAISAVEGLCLTAESEERLDKLRNSSLSPDQRRAEVIRAYKTGNSNS